MNHREEDSEEVLNYFLDMGEMMLVSGAEIKRVEDTLKHMGSAFGMEQTNFFVLLSGIMLTVVFPDGEKRTQIRRIEQSARYHFIRLEKLNHISRQYCANDLSFVEVKRNLNWIKKENAILPRYLGSIITTGGFAIYFGGKWQDALTAILFAICICWMQIHFEKFCPNKVVFHFLCSFGSGIGICLFSQWIPEIQYDKVIAADLILLLPGLALMNSVRDVLAGNTISGMIRLTESLIWTGGLACGFMSAIWLILHG